MLISCHLNDEKVPINAMKIGTLNNGEPLYSCCDSRKDECEFYKLIQKGCGELMICGFMTNLEDKKGV